MLAKLRIIYKKRMSFYFILFFVPFTVRSVFWFFNISSFMGWGIYDIQTYIDASKSYARGLIQLDLGKFGVNCEHPPLAKLILGLGIYALSPLLGDFKAAMMILCIVSSLTAVLVYFIGASLGGKRAGLIAWSLLTFDPYVIHWTVAWLDVFVNVFMTASLFFMVKKDMTVYKRWILAGLFGGLSTLSKYIAVPYFFLLNILLSKRLKLMILSMVVCIVVHVCLNVHLWMPQMLANAMSLNVKMNLGIPAILYGPIRIGRPLTYPWYILTYLGVGYTGLGVGPYIIPLITLFAVCYRVISRKVLVSKEMMWCFAWAAAAMIPLIFLPRHYWISLGEFPGIRVEEGVALVKTFYPYYHIITAPPLGVLAAILMAGGNKSEVIRQVFWKSLILLSYLSVLTFITLSPIAFASNIIFPFWDFLFTLIINIGKNTILSGLGIWSFIVCLLMMLLDTSAVLYMIKRIWREISLEAKVDVR